MLKISLFERYFLKTFLKYFVLSVFIFVSVFLMFSFIQIINEKGVIKGASVYVIFKTLFYLIPSILKITIPFSLVFSVFFTIGEISSRGELIAIRVGGYSYFDITKLFFAFLIFLFIFYAYIVNFLAPVMKLKSRNYARLMLNRITNIELKPKKFNILSEIAIYADEIKDNMLENARLYRDVNKKDSYMIINSEKGSYNIIKEKGIKLNFNKGNFYHILKGKYYMYNYGTFDSYSTFIPFPEFKKEYSVPPKFMTTPELFEILYNEDESEKIFEVKSEVYERYSTSVSVVLFGVLALMVAFYYERESKYVSFIYSLLMLMFYYGLDILFNVLAKKYLKPEINIFPSVIVTILAVFFYFKIRKK